MAYCLQNLEAKVENPGVYQCLTIHPFATWLAPWAILAKRGNTDLGRVSLLSLVTQILQTVSMPVFQLHVGGVLLDYGKVLPGG